MKKYKHLITIFVVAVIFAIVDTKVASFTIQLISFVICTAIIAVQIVYLSEHEKNKFDQMIEHIPKVMHIMTIIVVADTLLFNIIRFNETNRVYEKCGSGTFKYNSVAIKQLDIDISAIKDIVFKVGREMTVDEFYEKYSDTGKNIPYASLITIYIDGFSIEDIPDTIYLGYKTYKHFGKIWAEFTETIIAYMLIIWEICYIASIRKHKNKQPVMLNKNNK